jgi:hypothetical protein
MTAMGSGRNLGGVAEERCAANTKAPGYRPGAFACWVSLVLDGVRETEAMLTDRRLPVNC